jgi:hypothetical protein
MVDSASGVIVARAAGSALISATAEGKSGSVRVTVLPQPRTSRPEVGADGVAQESNARSSENPATERQRVVEQMLAGVEQCYSALLQKDVNRVEELYKPLTKSDQEKLRKLLRILETNEWAAEVGEREDGSQHIGTGSASMDFSFRLSWKDSFGGRLSSHPTFRSEFVREGGRVDMSSCRIIGSPKL